jgi:peroxiredoxin
MPIIQTAYDKYSRDQLIILAVNVRGDPDKVNYFVAKEKLTFPILMDAQGDADGLYRAPYFPTSYFIDTKGVIRDIEGERFQTSSQIDDILSSLN